MVDDEAVVSAAADAAQDRIFEAFDRGEVVDFDVAVSFDDGVFTVDVYLNVPGAPDADAVADAAARAARAAVDDLLDE